MTFEQKSGPVPKSLSLLLAYEQLKNVRSVIGYDDRLHDLMWHVQNLLNEEVELENEKVSFNEVEYD